MLKTFLAYQYPDMKIFLYEQRHPQVSTPSIIYIPCGQWQGEALPVSINNAYHLLFLYISPCLLNYI